MNPAINIPRCLNFKIRTADWNFTPTILVRSCYFLGKLGIMKCFIYISSTTSVGPDEKQLHMHFDLYGIFGTWPAIHLI